MVLTMLEDITRVGVIIMNKRNSTISINIVSALIILISLFIGVVGYTNAWFSAGHSNGVQILINVGDIKLKLYQLDANDNRRELTNTNIQDGEGETTNKEYIELSDSIAPGTPIELKLQLENKEVGSSAMYVRFKFQLFARGLDEDTEIPVTIASDNSWSSTQEGFKLNTSDNYYYYCATNGSHTKMAYNTNVMLINSFTIELADMYDNGELQYTSSESLYIKLSVDADLGDFTSV